MQPWCSLFEVELKLQLASTMPDESNLVPTPPQLFERVKWIDNKQLIGSQVFCFCVGWKRGTLARKISPLAHAYVAFVKDKVIMCVAGCVGGVVCLFV